MLSHLSNIYEIKVKYGTSIPHTLKGTKQTALEDIVKFEHKNERYKKSINDVLNALAREEKDGTFYDTGKEITKVSSVERYSLEKIDNIDLDHIAKGMIKICIPIYRYFGRKPHPVQCLTILRLVDEILNPELGLDGKPKTKGSIGEVKTGEGKSFIIAVVAILLTCYGRKIDIVTSNIELARRDQENQKKYFKLFNIKSGVLYNTTMDKEFMPKKQRVKEKFSTKADCYNVSVFNYPVEIGRAHV